VCVRRIIRNVRSGFVSHGFPVMGAWRSLGCMEAVASSGGCSDLQMIMSITRALKELNFAAFAGSYRR
jgi:hypothetical protein